MNNNEVLPHQLPSLKTMRRAFAAKDRDYDGLFFVAVQTTGIFCRPSCPSRPKPEHVEFFASVPECLDAGYRACKRCLPLETQGRPPAWIAGLIGQVQSTPGFRPTPADLRAMNLSPERVRRWFQHHYGMTFVQWCRSARLAAAFSQIRQGASLDEAAFDSGFQSHSGFRDAFARAFGNPPGRSRRSGRCVFVSRIESPIGPLLAGTQDKGVCLLDYADRPGLQSRLETLRHHLDCGIVPKDHPTLGQLRAELDEYFTRRRRAFSVPVTPAGTPFQLRVWAELQRIPYGRTISYETLAQRAGCPAGHRAVARANAVNLVSILIPCHRVIAKDGTLSGYGGGVWRKRLLIELERSGSLPP